MTNKFIVLVILITVLYDVCVRSDQPPYQVSIFINLHPKGPPIHLCNGAIVQSKLILTTAACVHYLLIPNRPVIPVHPSMLSVVAGSTTALRDQLTMDVSEIIFHKDFIEKTMENDLALLRLSASLPLGMRDDIKWIILDEFDPKTSPCLANFHVRNSMDKIPDYTQVEELEVFKIEDCLKFSKHPDAHRQDICSSYILPINFDCNDFNQFPLFNGDRGTGLICNSHLVGILSSILPLQEGDATDNNCSEKTVKAFYTNIGTYIEWAYDIIAQEEFSALSEENYTASTPFDQETEAIIVSQLSNGNGHDSSEATTLPLIPDVQPLLSNGASSRALFVSFQFFLLLLSIHLF